MIHRARIIVALLLLFFTSSPMIYPQMPKHSTDPAMAEFVYDDVANFVRVFKLLGSGGDTIAILENEYIAKGSPGLRAFVADYGLDAATLAGAIRQSPEDYAALPKKLIWLKEQQRSLVTAFRKLKFFIPDAVFTPTYFLVGAGRGIASGSIEGQLVTVEKGASKIVESRLNTLVVHELVHLNQAIAIGSPEKYHAIYGPEKSLLALSIREGMAEFFTELVTGQYTQEKARRFVYSNEERLWNKFKAEMKGSETGDWMWTTPADSGQPRDVGYVFGARIVEHYYKHSSDIREAVTYLLSLTDYDSFMERCQYGSRFVN